MANTTLPLEPTVSEAEFGLSYGAGYLSVAFSSMLYGVACLQTFHYFRTTKAKTDGWVIKALVIFMLIVNTVQQAAAIHTFYYYLITKRHQLDLVLEVPNVWFPTTSLLTAVAATTVDSFLTYRVWRLSGSLLVAGLCATVTLASTIASLVFHVQEFTHLHESLIQNELDLQNLGVTAMSITAAADISIAAVMSYYLLSKRTAFRRSNMMLVRLMTLSVTTGAISAILAFLTLASFFDKIDVLFFYSLSGKVYSNAFLTLLNVRSHIAGVWDNGESTIERSAGSVQLSHIPGTERAYRNSTWNAPSAPQVHILMERTTKSDHSESMKSKVSK
ncbi:hypothetical protein LXA43DRAFT_1020080 [Ganoderma leucocontextum]|nr:hypothetical protein LXA43DRAFT_1020080 [Ganoderma leucocontextum]